MASPGGALTRGSTLSVLLLLMPRSHADGLPGSASCAQAEAPAAAVAAGSGVPTPSLPGSATLLARAPAEPGSPEARRRSAWARLLAKVFEVDPLRCPRCQTEMRVVALITDPAVIDRILAHRRQAGLESPFDARGPPPPG